MSKTGQPASGVQKPPLSLQTSFEQPYPAYSNSQLFPRSTATPTSSRTPPDDWASRQLRELPLDTQAILSPVLWHPDRATRNRQRALWRHNHTRGFIAYFLDSMTEYRIFLMTGEKFSGSGLATTGMALFRDCPLEELDLLRQHLYADRALHNKLQAAQADILDGAIRVFAKEQKRRRALEAQQAGDKKIGVQI